MLKEICAVVVFYNPEKEVISNIASYIEFLDKLFIVDNSEFQTNFNIIEKLANNYKTEVKYIRNEANLGIAKALNIACDEAISNNYKWILTMDQDSSFCNFKEYLSSFKKVNEINTKISVVSPDYMKGCEHNDFSFSYEKRDITITSGSLINLSIYQKIGKFEEKLFIDEVDFEYCLRANINGYDVICLNNIPLKHNLGEVNEKKSSKKKIYRQHNYVRRYYIIRNRLYVSSIYGKQFKQYKMKRVLYEELYKAVSKIIRREDDKIRKLKSVYFGLKDYWKGKYGKFGYEY